MAGSIEHWSDLLDDYSDPRQRCFLCGEPLIAGGTAEHVFPQWAQRRYDLWNQSLNLANGTDIQYRHLTVPCCADCNNQRLRVVEDAMSQAVENGREAVSALGDQTLFLWLGKLFYGILYKELMLLHDRSDPKSGTIITEDFLKLFSMHKVFLQQARKLVELKDFTPGTIFVFDTQRLMPDRLSWDYTDSIGGLMVGVRVGRVALVGCLADGGAQYHDEHIYERYYPIPLHPLQFREICAQVAYRSSLATRVPKYIMLEGKEKSAIHQMPLMGFSAKSLFETWEPSEYAKFLAHYIGAPIDEVFVPPDRNMSWLDTPDGGVRYMDFKEYPQMPRDS